MVRYIAIIGVYKYELGNKTKPEVIDAIKAHVNSFPKYKSHYSHEDNSHRQFLSSSLTLQKMYLLYKEKCEQDGTTIPFRGGSAIFSVVRPRKWLCSHTSKSPLHNNKSFLQYVHKIIKFTSSLARNDLYQLYHAMVHMYSSSIV